MRLNLPAEDEVYIMQLNCNHLKHKLTKSVVEQILTTLKGIRQIIHIELYMYIHTQQHIPALCMISMRF